MSFLSIFGIDRAVLDQRNKDLQNLNLNKENALHVFPFTLQNGFIDLTESGETEAGDVVNDSSFFERIWTGEDNGIAVWDGSTSIKEAPVKAGTGTGTTLQRQYKVGDYFFGLAYESNLESKVGASAFQSEFTAQTQDESIQLFVPKSQYKVTKEDMLKVFLIPQLSQRWLRITAMKIGRGTDQEEIGYWVSMDTMDTSLGKTGASVFQTIQRSAPGEGYAWPQFTADNEIQLDPSRLRDIGVNEVQIELLGNMALAGLGLIGREVNGTPQIEHEIDQPHWIFGSEVLPAQPTRISKLSVHTPDLTPVLDMKPTLMTYFKNWKEDNKSNYDWSVRKKYEGIFDSNHDASINNTWNSKSMYDPANKINFPTAAPLTIKGTHSPYSQQDYTFEGELSLGSALAHNILGNMYVTQLPMQIEEAVARQVNDVPVVGKLLGLFNFGNHGWTRTRFDMKLDKGFFAMMSRMQYKFASESIMDIGTGNKGWIPMESFDNEKGSPVGSITASKSTNITIKLKLSDYVTYKNAATVENDNSKGLGSDFYWNEFSEVQSTDRHFAIDKFAAQIIGKGDYIVTFFNDGKPVHSSKHQTNAKFIDNTRAWSNITTFSPWAAYDVDKYPTSWKTLVDRPGGFSNYLTPLHLNGSNAAGDWSIPIATWNKYDTVAVGQTGHVVKEWVDGNMDLPKTAGKYLLTAEYTTGIWTGYVFYHLTIDSHYANIHIEVSGDLFHIAPAYMVTPPTLTLKTK